jgi:phage-related protein (TIGR01555 family)
VSNDTDTSSSTFGALLRRAVSRVDGWANAFTGVGAVAGQTRHRSRFAFQGSERQGRAALEFLYHEDPFARRIADALPAAGMRPGFRVRVGDESAETALQGALDDLLLARRAREAWTWSRVHGGGALLLGCDDGRRPEEELDVTALRAVRWIASVTALELVPHAWDVSPTSARFGEPVLYRLQRASSGGGSDNSLVHWTRVVRFEGLTTTRTRRAQLDGWGESVLQNLYDVLQEWNGAHASVTELLSQSSVSVFKMRDLMALLGSDPQGLLRARLEAMDLSRSVARSILLDADGESFERTEVGALSGFPELLDRYSLRVAGAAGMPVTVLLGRSPAGLNATGDADTRGWDDVVDAERRTVLLPALERVARLVLLSREGPTAGVEPEGWSVVLPPLRTSTPAEEAALRKAVSDTDVAYVQAGVLTPEEVARSRFRPEGWSAETTVDLEAREEPAPVDAEPDAATADATADNDWRSDALEDVDLTPTEEMADAARRALEARAEAPPSRRGMTSVGLARARDLLNGRALSPETVRRMKAYFDRHQSDKQGATWGDRGPGWQAWHGWGGDAGRAWAERKVAELDRAAERE